MFIYADSALYFMCPFLPEGFPNSLLGPQKFQCHVPRRGFLPRILLEGREFLGFHPQICGLVIFKILAVISSYFSPSILCLHSCRDSSCLYSSFCDFSPEVIDIPLFSNFLLSFLLLILSVTQLPTLLILSWVVSYSVLILLSDF